MSENESNEPVDEIVMYVVVRTDLNMSPGKMGAQIGHAVHLALEMVNPEWWTQWRNNSYPKLILRASSEKELQKLHARLTAAFYSSALVIDEGRTEIPPNSVTAVGVMPMPRSIAKPFVKRFQSL